METIRDQLEFQRWKQPSWIDRHFPAVADRGTPVEYADVEGMTVDQADAVRQFVAMQVLHGLKTIRKRKASAIGFLGNRETPDDEWPIRVKLLEEALRDLCTTYGLSYPL